ncbi:hypothetical protein HK100_012659 [Physocladia obscura]|uniref:Uncharacterized protein n=1 Tax=Physocladia obscura TaxID=109957 RepID=A0AAD5SZG2_9FUNG|nr:hypothetical protein HK100_012659 [Physocladia obscura]
MYKELQPAVEINSVLAILAVVISVVAFVMAAKQSSVNSNSVNGSSNSIPKFASSGSSIALQEAQQLAAIVDKLTASVAQLQLNAAAAIAVSANVHAQLDALDTRIAALVEISSSKREQQHSKNQNKREHKNSNSNQHNNNQHSNSNSNSNSKNSKKNQQQHSQTFNFIKKLLRATANNVQESWNRYFPDDEQ